MEQITVFALEGPVTPLPPSPTKASSKGQTSGLMAPSGLVAVAELNPSFTVAEERDAQICTVREAHRSLLPIVPW